jgi:hypothetical protein
LRLSLSYSIIKAGSGIPIARDKSENLPAGEAEKEGEGAEFIIQLPS